ncbi:MAG TPA: lyase family protein, partial [Nocardioidaceae bacterium]|nr:lyase family protein [Nocardioidaceae bacterium]
MDDEFRIEHDTMGGVQVPRTALWGAQTQRAIENFPISGRPLEAEHIRALALIKAAAARTNAELGVLDKPVADAIEQAALEIAEGRHDHEFPLDVFQTASGTSSNMNANEVIATLASATLGT